MKSFLFMAAVVLFATTSAQSQISNAKTEKVKIEGSCEMCKSSIEKAASKKKLAKIDWQYDTKIATITYDSKKTNLDAILKNIALAGYDNQFFRAPDEAYSNLSECCKYKREKKQIATLVNDTTPPTQNHNNHQHGTNDNSVQKTNQLSLVFDSYFALKDALVKTDANAASVKAKDLGAAINAVKMDKLPSDVHSVWMKVVNNLKEDATHINGTNDISHQRDHFITLSKNIYELIKVAKLTEPIYYQFCPMANDGKGANWLSKESTIKNPYYGSQMLTCGKTVETIK